MIPEDLFKVLGLIIVISLGAPIVRDVYHERTHRCIPIREKVERGYINPARLHFEFKDLDGNSTNEFLLNYESTRYLFKTNDLGEPFLQRYKVAILKRPNL